MAKSTDNTFNGNTILFLLFLTAVLLSMAYACKHYQQTVTETFENQSLPLAKYRPPKPHARFNGPAPLTYTMGDYDAIPLQTKCKEGWKKVPCSAPIGQSSRNDTIQGHTVPLELEFEETTNSFPNAPSIDGTKDQPQSDFMFAYNTSSPFCCPSTYSTSTGCICTTPEQREWLQSRGNNSPNHFEDL